jgi:hypothetical protein
MTSALTWSRVRQETIERFGGELPRPDTEAAIVDVFEINPSAVTNAIDRIAKAFDAGKVRSPWAVLKADLQGAADPLREVTVITPNARAKKIELAEQWVRNTGLHYATADEIIDDLFTSQQGRLHPWADDTALKTHIVDLWMQLRPQGIKTDEEEIARSNAWVARRKQVHINDNTTGRALVEKLTNDNVPAGVITTIINRAITDQTLRDELADYAADLAAQTRTPS